VNVPDTSLLIVTTLAAYLIGGLPFGYWFVRLTLGADIRTMGSGNIGATNVHRTAGSKAGIAVLLLDVLKGFVAVYLAGVLTQNNSVALALAGAAVMIGHCYPVFLKFKGGKAVACFVGAFAYLTPLPVLGVVAVFILTVAASKFVSLGSLVGCLVFPPFVWFFQHPPAPILAASLFAAVLVAYRHKGNIARLMAGTENAFSFKSKPKGTSA
jgi:glycerol-3-phosphate acyltransferase PlsY